MSGAPKRLHEEGSHSTPLKRTLDETNIFSGLPGKLIQPAGNDFHLPFESGQDGRLAKVQRTESRDPEKRSALVHRFSSSSNNSSLDRASAPENRSELRNLKEARDGKAENREKVEGRDFYGDTRMDPPGNKNEIDVRQDGRGDEKEPRSERASHNVVKVDGKFEKENYVQSSAYLAWKENKEHQRGKRYFESSADGFDSWRVPRHGLQNTDEVARNVSTAEERDSLEANEAVGENKVDFKADEKLREKDRKRKDEKHRDLGERDKDRLDRRNSLQLGSAGNERKDLMREDREAEKWERERRDALKDKERNDRDKDSAKIEPLVANEKEISPTEKEVADGSVRNPEQESTALEQKILKDESSKGFDKETKDKKRERDADVGDLPERGRYYDKESDDVCAEGDGVAEREREVFASGVQQRRRMMRSRGTPQTPNREPRFRSRARDIDGSQAKSEVSTVTYKAGECMQELLKSWKEFESSQENKNAETLQNGPTTEIRIPAEYVTAANHQVRGGQLWGTDVYTDDSDLVAVLMHTGYIRPTSAPPPSAIQELRTTIRVLAPQDCYTSTLRNNVRSRAWGAGIGCSFRVERCCIVKKGGGSIDLEPRHSHISAVEPTLAPVSVERTMTTRSAASNALRQQRFVREVTIQYNLCNEPWLKYSISVVADKGLKFTLYTSARLKKGEVLYLETHSSRYELCFNYEKHGCNGTTSTSSQAPESEQEKLQNHNLLGQSGERNLTDRENVVDVFRWSRCKLALPQNIMRSIGVPLPLEHLEVLEDSVAWEDVQWSQTGVWVAGKEYILARAHFLSSN